VRNRLLATLLALVLLAPLSAAHALQAREVNGYTIHYSAVTTDLLSPEVARAHGITRSPERVLLNIAVRRQIPGQPVDEPAAAQVSAEATNIAEQLRVVEMREVREPQTIYYLGEVTVADEEILQFTVEVQPEGETWTYTLEFEQQFFLDALQPSEGPRERFR
jgi:hypothetical protein